VIKDENQHIQNTLNYFNKEILAKTKNEREVIMEKLKVK